MLISTPVSVMPVTTVSKINPRQVRIVPEKQPSTGLYSLHSTIDTQSNPKSNTINATDLAKAEATLSTTLRSLRIGSPPNNQSAKQAEFLTSLQTSPSISRDQLVVSAVILDQQQRISSIVDRLSRHDLSTSDARQEFFHSNPDILNAIITQRSAGFRKYFETSGGGHMAHWAPRFSATMITRPTTSTNGVYVPVTTNPETDPETINDLASEVGEKIYSEMEYFEKLAGIHILIRHLALIVANQDFGSQGNKAIESELIQLLSPIIKSSSPTVIAHSFHQLRTGNTTTKTSRYLKHAPNGNGPEIDALNRKMWEAVIIHSSIGKRHIDAFMDDANDKVITHDLSPSDLTASQIVVEGYRDIMSQIGTPNQLGSYFANTDRINSVTPFIDSSAEINTYLNVLRDTVYFAPNGGVSIPNHGNAFPQGGYVTWGNYRAVPLSDSNTATIITAKLATPHSESDLDMVRIFADYSRVWLARQNTDEFHGHYAAARLEAYVQTFHDHINAIPELERLAKTAGFEVAASGWYAGVISRVPILFSDQPLDDPHIHKFNISASGSMTQSKTVTANRVSYGNTVSKEQKIIDQSTFWSLLPGGKSVGNTDQYKAAKYSKFSTPFGAGWSIMVSQEVKNTFSDRTLISIADQHSSFGVDEIAQIIKDRMSEKLGKTMPESGFIQVWRRFDSDIPKSAGIIDWLLGGPLKIQSTLEPETGTIHQLAYGERLGGRAITPSNGYLPCGFGYEKWIGTTGILASNEIRTYPEKLTVGPPIVARVPAQLTPKTTGIWGVIDRSPKDVISRAFAARNNPEALKQLQDDQITLLTRPHPMDKAFSFAGSTGFSMPANFGEDNRYLVMFRSVNARQPIVEATPPNAIPTDYLGASVMGSMFLNYTIPEMMKSVPSNIVKASLAALEPAISSPTQFVSLNSTLTPKQKINVVGVGNFTIIDLDLVKPTIVFKSSVGQSGKVIDTTVTSLSKIEFVADLSLNKTYAIFGASSDSPKLDPKHIAQYYAQIARTQNAAEAMLNQLHVNTAMGVLIVNT